MTAFRPLMSLEQQTTGSDDVAGRLARAATELFAPANTVAVLLLAVAWQASGGSFKGVGWAFLAIVFSSILPMAYVLLGVARARLGDRHVGERAQRPLPLAVAVGSMGLGWWLLAATQAPRDLTAALASTMVGLAAAAVVTLVWKVSIHAAAAAGAMAIVGLAVGTVAAAACLPVVVVVCWSRTRLGDHTLGQVVAGACMGTAVAAIAFPSLR